LAGTPIKDLARRTGIARNTLKSWAREARVAPGDPVDPGAVPQELGPHIADLINEQIAALRSICRLLRDPAWARRQREGELAVLGDHLADRLFALLTALEQGRAGDDGRRGIPMDPPINEPAG
jgi:hypothetical protein